MNDAATVCSGLIRLSRASRQIRSSRSTLSAFNPSTTTTTTTRAKTPRTTTTSTTAIHSKEPPSSSTLKDESLPHSTWRSTAPIPIPIPIHKPVHEEPITATTTTSTTTHQPTEPFIPSSSSFSSPPPPSPPRPAPPSPEPISTTKTTLSPPSSSRKDSKPTVTDSINSINESNPATTTTLEERQVELKEEEAQQEEGEEESEERVEINNLTSSKVPSSRLGRLMHYGGLAAGLGFGMASEAIKRTTYGTGSQQQQQQQQPGLLLSPSNVERLVNKLSKMRGAALKLGQFLSIQDSKLLSPQLETILHRVQNSANYMPQWQTEKVLTNSLGTEWKQHFENFDMKPFAAASIGQVHQATLSPESPLFSKYVGNKQNQKRGGLKVAVKVQFPGVKESISSDLSNLKWLLMATAVLPKGLYLDNSLKVLERELIQECDYEREAYFGTKMGQLVRESQLSKDFDVPKVIEELSGQMVLTTEMMFGKPLKSVMNLDQTKRDWIGTRVLDLCLHELFKFRVMQTDPNWSNFLYNERTKKIELIDFGASQEYSKEFIDLYGKLLSSAVREERSNSIRYSRELGYFTGDENEEMISAHLTSLFALAMPFRTSSPDPFPFGRLGPEITRTVRNQIPVMLKHRLSPPPEETYSLNRKLSGAFLLCERMESRVQAASMYRGLVERQGGEV
ncbi:hypothetical protein JCM3765_006092 [Sporobolomyces pararoseus]